LVSAIPEACRLAIITVGHTTQAILLIGAGATILSGAAHFIMVMAGTAHGVIREVITMATTMVFGTAIIMAGAMPIIHTTDTKPGMAIEATTAVAQRFQAEDIRIRITNTKPQTTAHPVVTAATDQQTVPARLVATELQ